MTLKKQRKVLGKLVRSSLGVKLPVAMKIGKLLHARSQVPVETVLAKLTEMGITYDTDHECRCGACFSMQFVDSLQYKGKVLDLVMGLDPAMEYQIRYMTF